MKKSLTINYLKKVYSSEKAKPFEVLSKILTRFKDSDQDAVWISTISKDELLRKCDKIENINKKKNLPLYGIPFSVKDNIDVIGFYTTAGCPKFAYKPKNSATIVTKLEEAGAICLGKTNLDQFATGLVGVRSPYGIPKNPFNQNYIPGGSSSGAAISISTGMVAFALGTDTGGSGRVPASYNGIYGFKPVPGSWSRSGLVYACRSFDTPSVFAAELDDVLLVDSIVKGYDATDAFSTKILLEYPTKIRVAMASPDNINTFGDDQVERLYKNAYTILSKNLVVKEADLRPFQSLNDLLFFGPYLAERDVSVGKFIDKNPDACHPIVSSVIKGSRRYTAADAYRAIYKTAEVKQITQNFWSQNDVLITPTVGALFTKRICESDPLGPNFQNGTYTNFANLLGLNGLAIPFGKSSENVPWGLTLYSQPNRVNSAVQLAKDIACFVKS